MWQNILVAVIIAAAMGYTLWRFCTSFTGKAPCCSGGCSCKGSCSPGALLNDPRNTDQPGKKPCCPR